LIGIAAINLLQLKPRILALAVQRVVSGLADLVTRLKRNVTREAILGSCILLIVGAMSVTPPARHIPPEWPLAFRWSWNAVDTNRRARSQMSDAKWLAIAGAVGLCYAVWRRRYFALGASLMSLASGAFIAHDALYIDAYPKTISVRRFLTTRSRSPMARISIKRLARRVTGSAGMAMAQPQRSRAQTR